jgi:putative addiction module component (TIGR02574 family)
MPKRASMKEDKGVSAMKRADISVSLLTLPEKLDLLEVLWADLSRGEENLESPTWHQAILENRDAALMSGKATVSDWEEAKERIRKNLS